MRSWLADTASLTLKLTAHSGCFSIRRLRQAQEVCLADEFPALRLPRRRRVQEREVLLLCDGEAMVYAHTIVPLHATAADWPFFGVLGERSLGSTLFGDPRVGRGPLEFARLPLQHPIVHRACRALGQESIHGPLYARRCLYRRNHGLLLVTEAFLPAIAGIGKADGVKRHNEFNK
jgi:chorismate--pyruvate lyase